MNNTITRITFVVAGLMFITGSTQAAVVALDFNNLPSSQGWTYESTAGFGGVGTGPVESAIMTVSGGVLVGDTYTDYSTSSLVTAVYRQYTPGIDFSRAFSIDMRSRVTNYETPSHLAGNLYGFLFGVNTGTESYYFGMNTAAIQSGIDNSILGSLDVTVFHDFLLEVDPGVGYHLYVDNGLIASGVGRSATYPAAFYFGDSTRDPNSRYEMTAFSISQDELNPVPVGGVLSLMLAGMLIGVGRAALR